MAMSRPRLAALRTVRHRPRDVALAFVVVVLGVPGLLLACALVAFFYFPPPVALPQPQAAVLAQTTHIYAADGSLLASLHAQYNRQAVTIDQMAPSMQQAVIASEDARFYQHSAIDPIGILRALWADLRAKSAVQGGSTITEQYVKQAYTGNQRSVFRTFREALLAAQLERIYSKKTILESYLNTVYFGDGAYGVEAAAQTYFNVHASQLTLSQSALLVGVIPAPGDYSPIAHPQLAEARRQQVLDRMAAVGDLTAEQAAQAKAAPPRLANASNVEVSRFPWFVDAVQTYLFSRYGEAKVFSGGLNVVTTLNPAAQQAAEAVMAQTLPDPNQPDDALVSIDPATGYVTALVGGRGYSTGGYNIAVQGRRQPGSSFKPFVLIAALENGITPSTTFSGPSTICLPGWKPDCHVTNFNGESFGSIPLDQATYDSVNTVYAQLVLKVGPQAAVNVANAMGIPGPSWLPPRPGCKPTGENNCGTLLTPLPSIALGSEEVTPLEMASAYATLAAGGVYRAPKVVAKVTDASGNVLESGPSAPQQAISPQIAATATSVLQEVIAKGTGTAANIGRPEAGKTGTASDYRNAWFVGYTPNLATAIWMGYRDSTKPMLNVLGVAQVTGGTLPALMWANYMKTVLATVPPTDFGAPAAPSSTTGSGFQLPYHAPPPAPSPSPQPPAAMPSPDPSIIPNPLPSYDPYPLYPPFASPQPAATYLPPSWYVPSPVPIQTQNPFP